MPPSSPDLPPIEVVRSPRESWKKCSLAGLRGVPGVVFFTHRPGERIRVAADILLGLNGEPLGARPARGLLVIDCRWRKVAAIRRDVEGEFRIASLPPGVRTAYPRRAQDGTDPAGGLASIEALAAALAIMGYDPTGLLAGYRWAAEFRALNPAIFPLG